MSEPRFLGDFARLMPERMAVIHGPTGLGLSYRAAPRAPQLDHAGRHRPPRRRGLPVPHGPAVLRSRVLNPNA